MVSMKAVSAIVANPSTIHRSSSPSFVAPCLLLAIPKALFVSAITRSLRRSLSISAVAHPFVASPTPTLAIAAPSPLHPFLSNEPCKGTNILVEALERKDITEVFTYPDGASIANHLAFTRSPSITNHLLHHEQGEVFATSDYARSIGCPGICIATSVPGTTNLVSNLADALLDFIPMVAITSQETPVVEVTYSITKYNYLIIDIDDIPHILKDVFFLASSDRPDPMLIDIPKDIQ